MLLDFAFLILLALAITGWRMRQDRRGRGITVVAVLLLVGILLGAPAVRTSVATGFKEGWSNTLTYLTGQRS